MLNLAAVAAAADIGGDVIAVAADDGGDDVDD